MFIFKNLDYLTDNILDLRIIAKIPANEEQEYTPAYEYGIALHGSDDYIGQICIRIGDNENIKFGGHIGYEIYESYRGKHHAARACNIIKQVALAYGMDCLIITCNPDNIASRKTCENIGALLIDIVDLPPDNDMYIEGERQKCRYEWHLLRKELKS